MTKSWSFFLVSLAACGSSTAPPDAAAPPPTTTPTTSPPATDAGSPAPLDAAPTAPTATTTTTAPSAPEVVTPEDTSSPIEDAASAPTGDLSLPAWAPEMVERLRTFVAERREGCIGMTANGRTMVSLLDLPDSQEIRVSEGSGRATETVFELPEENPSTIFANPALIEKIAKLKLVTCETIAFRGGTVEVPKAIAVTVSEAEGNISAQIAGNRAVTFSTQVKGAPYPPSHIYWGPDVGNLFVRGILDFNAELPDEFDITSNVSTLYVVNAAELGQPECLVRPTDGKPLGPPAPAFDVKADHEGCLAMTKDGLAAAFKIFYVDSENSSNSRLNSVEWHGPGPKPDLDLTCLVHRGCSTEDAARIAQAATDLGLVACTALKGAIALDGLMAPFMYQDDQLKLKTPTGWRSVFAFDIAKSDGSRDKMWHMWQFPTGGPLFVYVGQEGNAVSTVHVQVLDEPDFKLCPKPPSGVLKITDIKVSSAASDGGGYKFGAAQLVDGDPTSAWQPKGGKADAGGAWVELSLAAPTEVRAVEIANGFQRRDGVGDMFALNARVAEASLTFSDGSSETVAFGPDDRDFKRFDLATPRTTTTVKLTVTKLHEGARWKGDLAVSEIRLFGP